MNMSEISLDTSKARDLVNALRDGTVPAHGSTELAVGLDEPLRALKDQLSYVADGCTAIRFIEGAYGSGKTFLCSVLREEALRRGFAASLVVVSPDARLGKLPIVYSRIMDGIRTRSKNSSTALPDILEKWLLSEYRRASKVTGGSKDELHGHVLRQIVVRLQAISDAAPGVARAVKAYYRASRDRNADLRRAAISWLRGSHSVPLDVRRELGVRGDIGQEDLYGVLKAIALIVREAGYRGFLIIIDEAETIQRLSYQRQREDAYEVLRVLVDSAGDNRFPGCLFVVTGTEHFFQDPLQGLKSYKALADRIERPDTFTHQTTSRQPILHLTGLERKDLTAIAKKVRDIHATAYGWNAAEAVSDGYLEDIAGQVTDSFGESIERLPRGFLREIVQICDVAEEHGVQFREEEGEQIDDRLGARLQADAADRSRLENV